MQADDFANPTRFTGPRFARPHTPVFVGRPVRPPAFVTAWILKSFREPPAGDVTLPAGCRGAEVLVTDWNGDGSTGDILPGYNVGSYMRSFNASGLQHAIANYNATFPTNSRRRLLPEMR